MSTTVVGLFRETAHAQSAYNELVRTGFKDTEAFVKGGDNTERLAQEFNHAGVPEYYANLYRRGLEMNDILLLSHTADGESRKAEEIMERNGSLDLTQDAPDVARGNYASETGATGKPTSTTDYNGATAANVSGHNVATTPANTATGSSAVKTAPTPPINNARIPPENHGGTTSNTNTTGTTLKENETVTLPEIQEELVVGKRQVESSKTRVFIRVVERSVEAQVTLREEAVVIQRQNVDRAVTPGELDAMKDRTFDLTATSERAVVGKRAVVVEEVVVGKTSQEHTETVSDTVRSTQVEVEEVSAGGTRTPSSVQK